mgnify:CR=1 FL=1
MYDEWKNIAPYLETVDEFAMKKYVNTKVDSKSLEKVANAISNLPSTKKFLRKAEKLISERKKMFFDLKTNFSFLRNKTAFLSESSDSFKTFFLIELIYEKIK